MKRYSLLLFTVGITCHFIQAQTEQQLLPAELKQQTIITQPITLYKGFLRAGLAANYLFLDKFFDEDGKRRSISNAFARNWTVQAIFQYGVTDRLQVSADVPYVNRTVFLSFLADVPIQGTTQVFRFVQSGSGLGDITIGAKYQLITEKNQRPAVAIRGTIFLPSGQKNPTNIIDENEFDTPTGSGNFSGDLTLEIRKNQYPFLFSGFVGYKYNFEGSKILDVGQPSSNFQDGGLFLINGNVGYHLNEWMAVVNDFSYSIIGKDKINGINSDEESKWAFSYLPRLSFQIKNLRINQGITFPIVGKLSGADPSYFLIVQYVF